jgi:hypothetical protein
MRSNDRSQLENLIYPLAYAYGYPMENTPECAISARTGFMRPEKVSNMGLSIKIRGAICGRCGAEDEAIEPLFDLDLASTLIPMRYNSLKTYLSKHKKQFPARYMLTYGHRRVRMLTATEVKAIRAAVLRGPGRFFI